MKKSILTFVIIMATFFMGDQSVFSQSVEEFVEALTPDSTIRTRGIAGIREKQAKPKKAMYLQFGLDSAALKPSDRDVLRNLGRALTQKSLRDFRFRIEGHTCDLGSAGHNMNLSRRRADTVKNFLVRKFGIPAAQFQVVSYGETRPLAANTSENQRRKNRRVVIRNTLELSETSEKSLGSTDLRIVRLSNDREETVNDGDVLTQNDSYAVEFKSGSAPYVYIFQVDKAGKTTPIFPNPQISVKKNPVASGVPYRVPGRGKWFYLDENKGREQLIMVTHTSPVENPLQIAKNVYTSGASSATRGMAGIRKKGAAKDVQVEKVNYSAQSGAGPKFITKSFYHE